jgi:hypothetical protein
MALHGEVKTKQNLTFGPMEAVAFLGFYYGI